MKKTLFIVLTMIFALSASTFSASISGENDDLKDIKAENAESYLTEEEAELLILRIEEIREMDKSELSSEEKNELRNELKDIKKEIKRQGGVLYISLGTVLIVLLLILLLS